MKVGRREEKPRNNEGREKRRKPRNNEGTEKKNLVIMKVG